MLAISFLSLFLCICSCLPGPWKSSGPSKTVKTLDQFSNPKNKTGLSIRVAAPPRNAFVILWLDWNEDSLAAPEAIDTRYVDIHSALEIEGDKQGNGNVRVQLRYMPTEWDRMHYMVDVQDFGPDGPNRPPVKAVQNQKARLVWPLEGQVQVRNEDLIGTSGKGLVTELWSRNTAYNIRSNNCNHFIARLADRLGVKFPPDLVKIFQISQEHLSSFPEIKRVDVPVRYKSYSQRSPFEGQFLVEDPSKPVLYDFNKQRPVSDPQSQDPDVEKPDLKDEPKSTTKITSPFANHPPDVEQATPYGEGSSFDSSAEGEQKCRIEGRGSSSLSIREPCSKSTTPDSSKRISNTGTTELALTRSKGQFSMIASFAEPLLKGLDVAAIAVSPVFIILDLLEGQWKAAAFGMAAIAVGLAAELAIAGPIGSFIGAVVATLFSILPGLIFDRKPPPPSNNPAQIIQFAFFGDREHTGNEACNKNRTDAGLAPNCTALYGAGVLSKVFDWEMFDAVTFLIDSNKGHAMSILDMADHFHVIDHSKPGDGDNMTATIDCGIKRGEPTGSSRTPLQNGPILSPSRGFDCEKPKFSIKRENILIPILNTTADTIYRRIIPAPGGDCKILTDAPGGLHLSLFNLTVTGRPAAIACNLTSQFPDAIDGSPNYSATVPSNITNIATNSTSEAVLANATDTTSELNQTSLHNNSITFSNQSSNLNEIGQPSGQPIVNTSASINTTSDGSFDRAYIRPPPPAPFITLNTTAAVCLSSPTGSLCLPNGTYSVQKGSFNFSTSIVDTLSIPPGKDANVSFTVDTFDPSKPPSRFGQATRFFNLNWTESVSPSNDSRRFAGNMSYIDRKKNHNDLDNDRSIFDIRTTTDPPCVCLFGDLKYKGDVACFGPGGGNLTEDVKDKAMSMTVRGGAGAWVYPVSYGDLGAKYVSTDVEDLGSLPYGVKDSFSLRIKALWVEPAS